MAVFAIAMVKDEADIVARTVGHMLTQVDEVIVADNLSTDGTRDILADLPVTVVDDPEPGYYQSAKMTELARLAAERGATWVVPFDADEVWYTPFHDNVKHLVEGLAPQWFCAAATMYDHVATALDPAVDDPIKRIGWRRRAAGKLPKVACRVRDDLVIEQGNHAARYDGGTTVFTDHLVIRHYPYRSAEHFIRKARNGAAAYAATNLAADVGAHWRGYGAILEASGEEACASIFRQWFWSADPEHDATLLYDPAPI